MDHDLIFKIGTLLAGLIGTGKVLYELLIGGHTRLRDDYRFAKEFLKSVDEDPQMHPFLKEKGYQAIAGDRHISASEVEYLLSLQCPSQALRDYALGRTYLEHLQSVGNLQLKFRIKYQRPWSRLWRKLLYLFFYVISVSLAVAPFLFNNLFLIPSQTFTGLMICSFTVFAPAAWFSLVAAARVYRAEKLVENQSKHTQRVVVSLSNHSFNRTLE